MSESEYCYNAAAAAAAARKSKAPAAFESEDEYFERRGPKPSVKRISLAEYKARAAESDTGSSIVRNKKKGPAPGKRQHDSDDEAVTRRKTKEASKSKEAKRKAPRQHKAKKSSWQIFDSDSEEEGAARPPQQLQSSYTKRVADGVVRRTAQLEGGLFLDLKLYQVDDIKNVQPLKRHEKAVLALKFRGEPDSPELAALQQLLHQCKTKFVQDGYFYADK